MKEEKWIGAKEAAEIISRNSGRPVIQQYVRDLAIRQRKIKWKPLDGRQNVYLKSDVEKIRVKQIKPSSTKQETNGHPQKNEPSVI